MESEAKEKTVEEILAGSDDFRQIEVAGEMVWCLDLVRLTSRSVVDTLISHVARRRPLSGKAKTLLDRGFAEVNLSSTNAFDDFVASIERRAELVLVEEDLTLQGSNVSCIVTSNSFDKVLITSIRVNHTLVQPNGTLKTRTGSTGGRSFAFVLKEPV